MSPITADKMVFLLSGGPSNSNPAESLGGPASYYSVQSGINALFSDFTESQILSGVIDYRCIYVVNTSLSDTLYSASLHVESEATGEVQVELGACRRTESQVISIDNTVFFGSAKFYLDGHEVSAIWNGSAEGFAGSLTESLMSLGLIGVEVTNSYLGSSHKFTISFSGGLNNRTQPLLAVLENLLEGARKPQISIARQTAGSPINTVAPQIATPQVSPGGVEFLASSPESRIIVGDLGPGDRMPIWIRRVMSRGSEKKQNSNLVIKVSGIQ